MSLFLKLAAISVAVSLIAGALLELIYRSRNRAINDMSKATGLPKTEALGQGWFSVTCNSCGHIYLWYDEDMCECTRCGKYYRQETVDEFKRPPEDWEPS